MSSDLSIFGIRKNREIGGKAMKKSISEIKLELENADIHSREALFLELEKDERSGVQKLILKYKKEKEKEEKERLRLEAMKEFENKYADYEYICGIDEAGRGPLAGPVVAGAVILPKDVCILHLNDSKQLSAKMRDKLYDEIMEKAVAWAVGIASPARIDEINILQATYEAMREAISKLSVKPQILLNDAVTIPQIQIEQVPIVKGDARSVSIAAASIIAKVTRDRMMLEYDKLYPDYGFEKNKGYGSAFHIEKLKELGPCPIHRASFITHFVS